MICFICRSEEEEHHRAYGKDVFLVSCKKCGKYEISRSAAIKGSDYTKLLQEPIIAAAVRHAIAIAEDKKRSVIGNADQHYFVDPHYFYQLPASYAYSFSLDELFRLPKPNEQRVNLIRYLGEKLVSLGASLKIGGSGELSYDMLTSIVGCYNLDGLQALLREMESGGTVSNFDSTVTLTLKGWEEFEKLKVLSPQSRKVFMAMKFEDEKERKKYKDKRNRSGKNYLYTLYEKLQETVKDTGLELYTMSDALHANNINVQMEHEIRTSMFVIADLSHDNCGAYWEAGFAHGLNKKVILICNKHDDDETGKPHDDETGKPHFDVSHTNTHFWSDWSNQNQDSQVKEREFLNNIKSTIRNIFHDDSRVKMND